MKLPSSNILIVHNFNIPIDAELLGVGEVSRTAYKRTGRMTPLVAGCGIKPVMLVGKFSQYEIYSCIWQQCTNI